MFYDAQCLNIDVSSWNVSSVSDLGSMFVGAFSFNQNKKLGIVKLAVCCSLMNKPYLQ